MKTESPRLVLLCEDNAAIAAPLRRMLEYAGFAVLGPAASNAEALALVADRRPDVALLDGEVADGPADAIATELRRQGVPFVVSSAADPATLPPGLQSTPFIPKPAPFSALVRALKALT